MTKGESARRAAAVALGVTLLAVGGGGAAPGSSLHTYAPSRVAWTELVYQGSKLGIKAQSAVRIGLTPVASARAELIPAGSGVAVEPAGDQVVRVVIETAVRGTNSVSVLLLDPRTAAAYQRAQVSRSKKESYRRIYRYLNDGVFVQRHLPAGAAGDDPLSWPVHNTRLIEYPPGVAGRGVTEAMALFYMLSAADVHSVGDRLSFLNFDRDGMTEVVMTVERVQQMEVDYAEVSPRGERRVRESRTVALLTVAGSALADGDEFEFLGLRGELEIFADTELRIPVAVRGRVPFAGRTTVAVDRVVLR
jgi:hypothetical protein